MSGAGHGGHSAGARDARPRGLASLRAVRERHDARRRRRHARSAARRGARRDRHVPPRRHPRHRHHRSVLCLRNILVLPLHTLELGYVSTSIRMQCALFRRQQVNGGGDLPTDRRAWRRRGGRGCRRPLVHGPRVRRAAAGAAAPGGAAGASVRARRAFAQEQDRRLPPDERRDLRHDRRRRQRCAYASRPPWPTSVSTLLLHLLSVT